MQRYGDFRPTAFDSHIELDEREDWLVLPVSQTRDSGPLDQSNFAAALEIMGGEGDDVEVHRFGHWGPGWFEIIIFNPANADLLSKAEDIERSLEHYPVLDEDDLSRREYEQMEDSWSSWGYRDWQRQLENELNHQLDEVSDTTPIYHDQRWCQHWGMDVDLCQCGDCLTTETQYYTRLLDVLDNLSTEQLWELGQKMELDWETHSDGTYFRYPREIDLSVLCDYLETVEVT